MTSPLVFLLPLLLLVPAGPVPAAHYVPQTGDGFRFTEQIVVGDGSGDYLGYTETTFVNGSLSVTAVLPNGTESASFSYAEHYVNSTGTNDQWTDSGAFTFSAVSFLYVQGTDNQTGYTNPYVWFYMDNSTTVGGAFFLLNSRFVVSSTDYPFGLQTAAGGYVSTIAADASGSYLRNDSYGRLSATYVWVSYFDPKTGYIVGYNYEERDSNSSGSAFTYADTLRVTNTTYPLTPTSAPPAPSSGLPWAEVVGIGVGVFLVTVAVVAALVRRRRPRQLPQHPAGGQVTYTVPPPGPPPPPISLIPGGQPQVQQIVVKETVKVNCRYCGSLIDSTVANCPFCGATRT